MKKILTAEKVADIAANRIFIRVWSCRNAEMMKLPRDYPDNKRRLEVIIMILCGGQVIRLGEETFQPYTGCSYIHVNPTDPRFSEPYSCKPLQRWVCRKQFISVVRNYIFSEEIYPIWLASDAEFFSVTLDESGVNQLEQPTLPMLRQLDYLQSMLCMGECTYRSIYPDIFNRLDGFLRKHYGRLESILGIKIM